MLESDYPFTSGANGEKLFNCLYSQSKSSQHIVKVNHVEYHRSYGVPVNSLKAAIKNQPVTIAVTANNKYIHSYASGIIDATSCYKEILYGDDDINPLNHSVLAVGYGRDKTTGLEYFLVKNSWNTSWGDHGYFKLK